MNKVLNFGSLNIDYVYAVDHFVSAGETLSSESMEVFSGGKGLNQSVALARAGAAVYHAGCVGNEGAFLIEMLRNSGADTRFTCIVDDVSGHAIIQVGRNGQNCILLFGGANQQIECEHIDHVLESFGSGDWLLVQNEINNLSYLIKAAKKRELKIAFNPSPINSAIFKLPMSDIDLFVVNEIEGCAITETKKNDEILNRFRNKYPSAAVLLTLGKQGAVYDDGNIKLCHGIYNVPVVDTTAAGDTFTGYFLAANLKGYLPEEALVIASKASSIAVSNKGAAPSIPLWDEVVNCKLKLI